MGRVTASLDTTHYKGPISKAVMVRTNDATAGAVSLELRAHVVSVIDILPTETPVVRSPAGPTPAELTLSAADGKPFDVIAVQADPAVTVDVRLPPNAPPAEERAHGGPIATGSNRYLVTVAPREDAPPGQIYATIGITTNRANAGPLVVRAVLFPLRPVEVLPERLLFEPAPEPPVLYAKVRRTAGKPLEILGVESSDPQFTATAKPATKGREYDIAVRYTGKPGKGPVSARVTVKTNEPAQPTIVIPLAGRL